MIQINTKDKSEIYQNAKFLCKQISQLAKISEFDNLLRNRLKSTSLDIVMHIAGTSGRFCKLEKRKRLVLARVSALECLSVLDVLHDCHEVSDKVFQTFSIRLNHLSNAILIEIKNLTISQPKP